MHGFAEAESRERSVRTSNETIECNCSESVRLASQTTEPSVGTDAFGRLQQISYFDSATCNVGTRDTGYDILLHFI